MDSESKMIMFIFGFNSKIMINRYQLAFAEERLFQGKALIVYGPRQVGKPPL